MPLPNFLFLGVPKAGTTSLYVYLRSHPQIYMPAIKEPRFMPFGEMDPPFRHPLAHTVILHAWAEYQALFDGVTSEIAIGDASPSNYYPRAYARIQNYLGQDLRFVLLLRHPVDRAYSHFTATRRDGMEPIADFETVMVQRRLHPIDARNLSTEYDWISRYAEKLAPFFASYGRERICVLLQEEFDEDTVGTVQQVYRFLGVDPDYVPVIQRRYNVTTGFRSTRLGWWWREMETRQSASHLPRWMLAGERLLVRVVNRLNRVAVPPLDPALRARLTRGFRDDILATQEMVGRDLSHWLAE